MNATNAITTQAVSNGFDIFINGEVVAEDIAADEVEAITAECAIAEGICPECHGDTENIDAFNTVCINNECRWVN